MFNSQFDTNLLLIPWTTLLYFKNICKILRKILVPKPLFTVFENYAKLTGKHLLCRSFFLNKVADLKQAASRTPQDGCFC